MGQGWRTAPLPPGWERVRRRVLRRDGYRCYVCGAEGASQVDHIIPVSRGGTDDESNLASICNACHAAKTSREANARNPKAAPRKRQPERHPGFVD